MFTVAYTHILSNLRYVAHDRSCDCTLRVCFFAGLIVSVWTLHPTWIEVIATPRPSPPPQLFHISPQYRWSSSQHVREPGAPPPSAPPSGVAPHHPDRPVGGHSDGRPESVPIGQIGGKPFNIGGGVVYGYAAEGVPMTGTAPIKYAEGGSNYQGLADDISHNVERDRIPVTENQNKVNSYPSVGNKDSSGAGLIFHRTGEGQRQNETIQMHGSADSLIPWLERYVEQQSQQSVQASTFVESYYSRTEEKVQGEQGEEVGGSETLVGGRKRARNAPVEGGDGVVDEVYTPGILMDDSNRRLELGLGGCVYPRMRGGRIEAAEEWSGESYTYNARAGDYFTTGEALGGLEPPSAMRYADTPTCREEDLQQTVGWEGDAMSSLHTDVGSTSTQPPNDSTTLVYSSSNTAFQLSTSPSVQDSFSVILARFLRQIPFQVADIWVPVNLSSESRLLVLGGSAFLNPRHENWGSYSRNFYFRPSQGLPGRVLQEARPEAQTDVTSLTRDVFPRVDGARSLGLHATLGIPVRASDGTQMVVVFYSHDAFTPTQELVRFTEELLGRWNFKASITLLEGQSNRM